MRLAIIERGTSEERHVVSDAVGRFVFPRLPVGGIRVFVVSTEHGGVRYESERIVLTQAASARSIVLTVYEPVRDRSAVRVALVFGVVDIARGALRVSVVERLENPTDRTAVPTVRDPLAVPLPSGAEAVTFLGGWRDPRVVRGQIEDVIPVPPGGIQVSYAYGLRAGAPMLAVPWRFPEGVADVEVLVAQAGVRIAADGLRPIGAVTEAGRRYERWSGGPFPPGGQATVRLDGLPVARDFWPALVAASLGLALGGGLLLALRRPRRGRESEEPGGGEGGGAVEVENPARVPPGAGPPAA